MLAAYGIAFDEVNSEVLESWELRRRSLNVCFARVSRQHVSSQTDNPRPCGYPAFNYRLTQRGTGSRGNGPRPDLSIALSHFELRTLIGKRLRSPAPSLPALEHSEHRSSRRGSSSIHSPCLGRYLRQRMSSPPCPSPTTFIR